MVCLLVPSETRHAFSRPLITFYFWKSLITKTANSLRFPAPHFQSSVSAQRYQHYRLSIYYRFTAYILPFPRRLWSAYHPNLGNTSLRSGQSAPWYNCVLGSLTQIHNPKRPNISAPERFFPASHHLSPGQYSQTAHRQIKTPCLSLMMKTCKNGRVFILFPAICALFTIHCFTTTHTHGTVKVN